MKQMSQGAKASLAAFWTHHRLHCLAQTLAYHFFTLTVCHSCFALPAAQLCHVLKTACTTGPSLHTHAAHAPYSMLQIQQLMMQDLTSSRRTIPGRCESSACVPVAAKADSVHSNCSAVESAAEVDSRWHSLA